MFTYIERGIYYIFYQLDLLVFFFYYYSLVFQGSEDEESCSQTSERMKRMRYVIIFLLAFSSFSSDFICPCILGGRSKHEENTKVHPLEKLQEKLGLYLMELPILGFNSGKYDINAAKNPFFAHLVKYEQVKFVIKRNNNHMCLKTLHLKFLDITNYLAPGFSYQQLLKAYECTQTKGNFLYECVDSLEELNFPTLPPPETFHSMLSNTDITDEQYSYCQCVWNDNNMETFSDFLIWYNNLDVVPFLEAIDKMSDFWKERNIDTFKHGVSVPG